MSFGIFVTSFLFLMHQQEAAGDEKEAQDDSKVSEEEFDLAFRKLFDTLPNLHTVSIYSFFSIMPAFLCLL